MANMDINPFPLLSDLMHLLCSTQPSLLSCQLTMLCCPALH